jgi:hypothetical protein
MRVYALFTLLPEPHTFRMAQPGTTFVRHDGLDAHGALWFPPV